MPVALLLFIGVPVVEMYILIKVGGIIGALPTIALVVLTATVGLALLKHEGLATLGRVQAKLDAGQLPDIELLEGIMLLVGGALLLTPGFVTDAIGFTCILPGLRQPLARWLISRVGHRIKTRAHFQGQRRDSADEVVIEGEFVPEQQSREELNDKH